MGQTFRSFVSGLFVVFSVAAPALAGRKVSIPISGALKLSNTSSVTVTYNVSCRDKDAVAIATLTLTAQTLAAGKTASVFGASTGSACGAGWTEATLSGALPSMKRCNFPGGTTLTAALSGACASNFNPCSLQNVYDYKGTMDGHLPGGAFAPTGTWSYYDGTSWTDYNGLTTHYPNSKFSTSASQKFASGPAGSGTVFNDGGWVSVIANSVYDMLCCSAYGEAAVCDVEITSSTGHLTSPGFLGGKAF